MGLPTKPEYCFSVVRAERLPPRVALARTSLAQASESKLQAAVQACKERADEILKTDTRISEDFTGMLTLNLWWDTLVRIAALADPVPPKSLEHCLYAFLIIQACAVATGEPVLLFTPRLLQQLLPLQHLLPGCEFFDAARSVIRMFWQALYIADYGCEERDIQLVWNALPWFGVSASLSGSPIPLEGANLNSLLSILKQIRKEQLCTNASTTPGWNRPPPPYVDHFNICLLYTSPSPRDATLSRMPSSA